MVGGAHVAALDRGPAPGSLPAGVSGELDALAADPDAGLAERGETLKYDASTVADAAPAVNTFAELWAATPNGQNEHALESRILRVAVPIRVGAITLDLIQADPAINWGSQFPAKWGPGGARGT